ncbi:DMT family transporter [Sulfurospirillum arsenophilum]|uniref:DMT family transporter n=1 Tax=Sulfurospirillum arsenophilum TaxID=56698 RepID=UPI000694D644|nr:DMT family transporter [Sulfurospirillum arsenophilum]
MKQQRIDLIGILFLLTAMLTWASSFIAFKAALGPLGPMSLMFGRMLIASLCFVYFINGFRKLEFTKKDVKYILLLTFFEPCLYFVFEAKALQLTTASQAGMITSMMPLMTAIAASFVLKEYLSKRVVIGSALAVAGAVWLSLGAQSSEHASNPLLGNFLEFCAMVCGTWYAISVRYLSQRFSALFLTAIQAFIGTIFFAPLALWEYVTLPMSITWEVFSWMCYLGIVVTLGGYGMFNLALSRIEASRASVFVNLIPVFTVLLAYLLLGEVLTQTEMMASFVIFGGIIISQLPRFRAKEKLT